jgi:predicted ArsR family transcriptional regulator
MAGLDHQDPGRDGGFGRDVGFEAPSSRGHIAAPHGAELRRVILFELRRNGPTSPDQLARRAGSSRSGVLQQLRAMEIAGVVSRQTVRHGVGRPRHLYDVTPDAQGQFPSNYDGLATDILTAVQAVGGEILVEDVFEARRRQLHERVAARLADRLPATASLADRVHELAMVQDELGYLCHAAIEPDGETFRLSEHNCAIYQVAKAHPSACQAEVELFRDVLGAEVVRVSHITSGDRSCSYLIAESAPSTVSR